MGCAAARGAYRLAVAGSVCRSLAVTLSGGIGCTVCVEFTGAFTYTQGDAVLALNCLRPEVSPMRNALFIAVFAGLLAAPAFAASTPTIVTPTQVQWTAGTGPLAGVQVAMLSGDPSKPGPYTMRLHLADGAKFGPHFHGDVENVTVIQGTLLVGLGDTMDPAKMIALPAGSFVSVPIGLHHYAMAKGDTIIQIHGMGPQSMTMLPTK